MPFGSNHNQTRAKKSNPGKWLVLLAVFPLIYLFFRFLPGEKPAFETSPAAAISYSDRVRQVEAFCEGIPKPDGFYQIEKMPPAETARYITVGYKYSSMRTPEEIYPNFIIWLTSNGWTDNRTPYKPLEYSKDNKTFGITPVRANDGDYYLITCTEWITD